MYFVLKSLKILFTLFSSTCFGHHCVHHQEHVELNNVNKIFKGFKTKYI